MAAATQSRRTFGSHRCAHGFDLAEPRSHCLLVPRLVALAPSPGGYGTAFRTTDPCRLVHRRNRARMVHETDPDRGQFRGQTSLDSWGRFPDPQWDCPSHATSPAAALKISSSNRTEVVRSYTPT